MAIEAAAATEHAELDAQLERLHTQGAEAFDPLHFAQIQALANRVRRHEGAIAARLADKLHSEIYALSEAQSCAAITLRNRLAKADNLDSAQQDAIVQQINQGQLAEAERSLKAALRRQSAQPSELGALSVLLNQTHDARGDTEAAHPMALEDLLLVQEDTLLGGKNSATERPLPPGRPAELRSARAFRGALSRHHADALVNRVLAQAPEDSGPLNPQKLASRSLEIMRERSPAYLNRMVAYIDTLFWLEQTGD